MRISNRIKIAGLATVLIGGALSGVLASQNGQGDPGTLVAPAAVVPGQPVTAQVLGGESGFDATANTPMQDAGTLFSSGFTALEAGDLETAQPLLEEAARLGHLGAQWKLARMFLDGTGVAPDPLMSLHYLRRIAMQHDPELPYGPRTAVTVEALVELGRLYRNGVPEANLRPSPVRAFSLLNHAATLYRHPRAQHYIGLMYLSGEGVRTDPGRGVRWLFLAATKHYAPAQSALGTYYWERRETADNRLKALMWMSLAAENAKQEEVRMAYQDRFTLAVSEIGGEDRALVDTLIKDWKARYVVTTAAVQ